MKIKSIINKLIFLIILLLVTNFNVNALTINSTDIPNNSYVIGKHIFTAETTLTTKHIMLASKSIEKNNLNDMKIYYKSPWGTWWDGLSGEDTNAPATFDIEYRDLKDTEFTVSFDTNGGSNLNPIEVESGKNITIQNNPTLNGYKLKGWNLNGKAFDLNTPITSDIKLVAEWEPISYTVKFNNTCGSQATNSSSYTNTYGFVAGGTMEDQVLTYDIPEEVAENTFSCKATVKFETDCDTKVEEEIVNAELSGWTKTKGSSTLSVYDNSLIENLSSTDGEIVNLYSVYRNDVNGITLKDITRENYKFEGWYTSSTFSEDTFVGRGGSLYYPKGNTTLYAKWTYNSYNVAFDSNGGTGIMETQTYNRDNSITLPKNTFNKNYSLVYNYNDGNTEDETITLQQRFMGWTIGSKNLLSYADLYQGNHVKVDDDTGLVIMQYDNTNGDSTVYVNLRYSKKEDLPKNTYYRFIMDVKENESTDSIGLSEGNYSQFTEVNTGVPAISISHQIANDNKVKHMAELHSLNSYTASNIQYLLDYNTHYLYSGEKLYWEFRPVLVPDRGSNNASSYYIKDEASIYNLSAVDSTITLYADWAESSTILKTPTREGYIFEGWYSTSTFSVNSYVGKGGDKVYLNKNTKLYAKWISEEHTISNLQNNDSKNFTSITDNDDNGYLSVGDLITYDTESFYVYDFSNSNVKMLAKSNLFVGGDYNKSTSVYTPYGEEKTTLQGDDINGYDSSWTTNKGIIRFDNDMLGLGTDVGELTQEQEDAKVLANSDLKPIIDEYKTKIINLGASSSVNVKLLTYTELENLEYINADSKIIVDYEWLNNKSYWLGTSMCGDDTYYGVAAIKKGSTTIEGCVPMNDQTKYGVRPVIELNASDL